MSHGLLLERHMTLSTARKAQPSPKRCKSEKAAQAAIAGLDFLVRNQCADVLSADHGRFPIEYDCLNNHVVALTGNWTTAIATEALLAGYRFTGNKPYLAAASKAVEYLKSLQEFSPMHPRLQGVFREETPQTSHAMPRDSLTAAWALLDWSQETHDNLALKRVEFFADWFINVAMEQGVPLLALSIRYQRIHSGMDGFISERRSVLLLSTLPHHRQG